MSADQFVILWDFYCRSDSKPDFVAAYGPEGDWVQLFRKGEGFIRSELLADAQQPGKFLVSDYWETEGHYQRFKDQFAVEYKALDDRCTGLSSVETFIGSFHVCP